MAARVSAGSSSHASSASRGSAASAASREPPPSADNGFSSQLSAASRQPAAPDPSNDGRHDASSGSSGNSKVRHGDARSASGASGKPPAKAPTSQATSNTASDQAQSAAAAATEADASSIDPDLTAQGGKPSDKTAGKLRSDGSDPSVASDPATLALLLAASGLQVDARSGYSQSQGDSSSDSSSGTASDDKNAAAIAGTAAAAAAIATTAPALPTAGSAAADIAATQTVPGDATVSPAVAGATRQTASLAADVLSAGTGPGGPSSADAPSLQNKSSAPDALQPQPTSVNASGMTEMVRGLSSAVNSASGVERTVSVPVMDRNWGGAVGNQVQWMVNNNIQSATLQVSPDHLGPVEVRIDVQSSQVNVSFTAQHPDTRSALEQSVPQLRALLAGGGLTLGHTSVQQETRSNSHYSQGSSRSAPASTQTVASIAVSSTRGIGLIDEYA